MGPVGRGRKSRSKGPSPSLTVKVHLDDDKRGRVIGVQGATVKETQRLTGAHIRAPRRGDTGPLDVSGPSAAAVLDACCMIARQTGAVCACTCSVPNVGELAATLHPTDAVARHVLFQSDAGQVPFVAFCLSNRSSIGASQLAALVDDATFAAGHAPDTAMCAVEACDATSQWICYGVGPGTAVASALYDQLLAEAQVEGPASSSATTVAAHAAAATTRDPYPCARDDDDVFADGGDAAASS